MPEFILHRGGLFLIAASLLSGCGRDGIQVYQVAKETPPASPASTPERTSSSTGLPKVAWKLPAGWEEAPAGEMRLASFRAKGGDGQVADVGIFPLPGMAGSDLSNVNRWRGQVGQGPITEEELARIAEPVPVSGETAKLYDQAGENPGSGDKTRVLAAILRREGVAWFFKMTGPDTLVAQQKAAFVDWLKSVSFAAPVAQAELPPSHPPIDNLPAATGATGASSGSSGKPQWQVPPTWREMPAGQFLVAKFTVPADNDQSAAVNVSMSAGDGGGLPGNVNRWRRQLGLSEIPEPDVANLMTSFEVTDGKASLVDMAGTDPKTGQKTRLVGAIVPRSGQTWFYKLMGPDSVVQSHKDAFQKFIQTAKYNAS